MLATSAKGLGIVTATPEIDGVTRRMPLVVNVQSKLYPNFALELLRLGVGDPSYQIKTEEQGIVWVRIPNYPNINTDQNGSIPQLEHQVLQTNCCRVYEGTDTGSFCNIWCYGGGNQ